MQAGKVDGFLLQERSVIKDREDRVVQVDSKRGNILVKASLLALKRIETLLRSVRKKKDGHWNDRCHLCRIEEE